MQIPLAFLVGAPGGGELLLIFVVILLMFGPKRLPEMARNIGKAMDYLRRTSQDFREQMMRMDEEVPKMLDSVLKDPAETVDHPEHAELLPPASDTNTASDPYQSHGDSSIASVTPRSEEAVSETEETKAKEENAGKIETNSADSMENVPGTGRSDAEPEERLAG